MPFWTQILFLSVGDVRNVFLSKSDLPQLQVADKSSPNNKEQLAGQSVLG